MHWKRKRTHRGREAVHVVAYSRTRCKHSNHHVVSPQMATPRSNFSLRRKDNLVYGVKIIMAAS